MRPVVPFRRWCRQASLAWILISVPILLGAHVSGRNFGYLGQQDSLKSMRERDGIQLSTRARDGRQTPLSPSGKLLLSKIAEAGNRTDWNTVQRLFSSYNGTETQIFNAVLHLASRCSQCKAGARIYERVCQLSVTKNSLTFTAAIAIHSELKQPHVVRQIWTEALQSCSLDEPLAQARIAAAAAGGDVYTAAEVLGHHEREACPNQQCSYHICHTSVLGGKRQSSECSRALVQFESRYGLATRNSNVYMLDGSVQERCTNADLEDLQQHEGLRCAP